MQQFINTEFKDGVGWISLNRADKRNALNREMLAQFCSGVDKLNSNSDLRALVLQAVGPVFCAGMDLGQMHEVRTDPSQGTRWQEDSRDYHNALLALLNCRVPTIAAVHGPAIAGGVGLILACDIVIASDSAFFALPEPHRGIAAAIVAPLLSRRLGPARAGYVLLSAKKIPAEQAMAIGLCDEFAPQSGFKSAVHAMLRSILESAPQALATTKRFLGSLGDADLRKALRRAIDVSAEARATEEAREGLSAFRDKRKPAWAPQEDA